ncbi:hypothetical protein C0Q70_09724 [Pomacea canaliculata]|uniref:Uncharacterized protein n=1 Tax=Pomacea canaliculata TaxID=400727 RepID=A0A2T7PAM1_POMCA|nr:hypothetical protein C0Q70_09724 [Pomacea canaliculata]
MTVIDSLEQREDLLNNVSFVFVACRVFGFVVVGRGVLVCAWNVAAVDDVCGDRGVCSDDDDDYCMSVFWVSGARSGRSKVIVGCNPCARHAVASASGLSPMFLRSGKSSPRGWKAWSTLTALRAARWLTRRATC